MKTAINIILLSALITGAVVLVGWLMAVIITRTGRTRDLVSGAKGWQWSPRQRAWAHRLRRNPR